MCAISLHKIQGPGGKLKGGPTGGNLGVDVPTIFATRHYTFLHRGSEVLQGNTPFRLLDFDKSIVRLKLYFQHTLLYSYNLIRPFKRPLVVLLKNLESSVFRSAFRPDPSRLVSTNVLSRRRAHSCEDITHAARNACLSRWRRIFIWKQIPESALSLSSEKNKYCSR